jgi:hypothetical protein
MNTYPANVLFAIVLIAAPMAAMGERMYRCGNSYQDTPCQNGEPMSSIAKGSAAQPAQTQSVDPECAERAKDALKIVWTREAGATSERQLAEIDGKGLSSAKAAVQRQLIASVYQKRGSAPAISSQIEGECLAEKEKLRQLQALGAAAAKLTDELPPSARPNSPVVSDQNTPETRRVNEQGSAENSHTRYCARLSRDLESVRKEQRAGGSAANMDKLRENARQLGASLRTEGC